jgi:hypothetical protein
MVTKHPSGRPVVRVAAKSLSIFRGANKGSELPRLRDDVKDLSLVGFHHRYQEIESDADENKRK